MPKLNQPPDQFTDLHFPMAGVNLTAGFDRQPNLPTDTGYARSTPIGENVRGYEPGTGRARGGQRPGVLRYVKGAVKFLYDHVQEIQAIVGTEFAGTGIHSPYGSDPTGNPGLGGVGFIPGSESIGTVPVIATASDDGVSFSTGNRVIWTLKGPGGKYGTWSMAIASSVPGVWETPVAAFVNGSHPEYGLAVYGGDMIGRTTIPGLGGSIVCSVTTDGNDFYFLGTSAAGQMIGVQVGGDGVQGWSQTAIGATSDASSYGVGSPSASIVQFGTLYTNFRNTGIVRVVAATGVADSPFSVITNADITVAMGTQYRNAGQLAYAGNVLAILCGTLTQGTFGVLYVDRLTGVPTVAQSGLTTLTKTPFPYQERGGEQFITSDGTSFYLMKFETEIGESNYLYSRVVKLHGTTGAVLWTSVALAGSAASLGYASNDGLLYVSGEYTLDPTTGAILAGGCQPGFKGFFDAGGITTVGEISGGGFPTNATNYNRAVILLAVAGGTVRVAFAGKWQAVFDGFEALSITAPVIRSAINKGKVFFADAASQKYYEPSGNAMLPWIVTAGTLPIDSAMNLPRLIVTWRGRTCLSGLPTDGKNIFMSRQNNPFDFDYAPASRSAADAVALNLAPMGLLGDIVTTMVPFNDDVMVVGCDHSIFVVRGDPNAGGQIDLVTNAIGMAWGIPWCQSPDGTIYFVSNMTSIFTLVPGQQPQRISQDIDSLLRPINLDQVVVRMMWDESMQGCHAFFTVAHTASPATHFFFEVRSRAWWVDSFTGDAYNPVCCLSFYGNTVQDRVALIGSWEGYVRAFSQGATNDDGRRIESEVAIGPILTKDMDDVTLKDLQAMLGTESGQVTYEVLIGDTPERAIDAVAAVTGIWKSGRNLSNLVRRAGHALYVVVSANRYWAMETVRARIAGSGKVRRRGY